MPGDLAVSSPASFVPTTNTPVGGSTGAAPSAAARAGEPSASGVTDAGTGKSSLPNPSLRLDSQLGLVVIEFRNDSGGVTESIPTPRQLQAYRDSERAGTGADAGHGATPRATAAAPAILGASSTSEAPITVQQAGSAKPS